MSAQLAPSSPSSAPNSLQSLLNVVVLAEIVVHNGAYLSKTLPDCLTYIAKLMLTYGVNIL
jgi:hypothetical protein